jgi:hypothetical protein
MRNIGKPERSIGENILITEIVMKYGTKMTFLRMSQLEWMCVACNFLISTYNQTTFQLKLMTK